MLPNSEHSAKTAKTVSFQMLPNSEHSAKTAKTVSFQMLPNSEHSAKQRKQFPGLFHFVIFEAFLFRYSKAP